MIGKLTKPQEHKKTITLHTLSPLRNLKLQKKLQRKLLKITDVLGRVTTAKQNTPLFYIYDDGTVDKQIIFNK